MKMPLIPECVDDGGKVRRCCSPELCPHIGKSTFNERFCDAVVHFAQKPAIAVLDRVISKERRARHRRNRR